jgi:hypothetical protein
MIYGIGLPGAAQGMIAGSDSGFFENILLAKRRQAWWPAPGA